MIHAQARRMEYTRIMCLQVYIGDLKAVINYVTVYIVYYRLNPKLVLLVQKFNSFKIPSLHLQCKSFVQRTQN